MLKTISSIRRLAMSVAIGFTSFCAVGQIVEPTHARLQTVAHAGPATLLATKAAVAAANVRDVDQPARAPFQATVSLNFNNFTYTNVAIPVGQRLVIEYVSISGFATAPGGPVQPIAILSASNSSNPNALYYIAPSPSSTLPTQFYHGGSTAIYADTLDVAPAFAGATPSFMIMNLVISGHLISIP